MKRIMNLLKSTKGQGMVEYGLIIALIAIVVIVALTPAGTAIANVFTEITNSLGGATTGI